MICSTCQRSGYSFQKIGSKIWCGSCETPGTRTLTQTMLESASGFNPYGMGSPGTVDGLPKLCSLSEWHEISTLCKKVSKSKLLFEDDFKPLPLPKCKNPLYDTSDSNWMPLEDYYILNNEKNPSESQNLFEG